VTEIQLPEDKARVKRGHTTTEPAGAEAPQQTLAEYERLAIGTGEWKGTDAPEFSDDGETWTTAWGPVGRGADENPVFARATVYRKGVRPIVVVIRWDEALPAVDFWRDLWLRKPVTLFGAFALRAAYRRAFRDVIGDQYAPDEQHTEAPNEGRGVMHYLIGVSWEGERCACGRTVPRLRDHLFELALADIHAGMVTA